MEEAAQAPLLEGEWGLWAYPSGRGRKYRAEKAEAGADKTRTQGTQLPACDPHHSRGHPRPCPVPREKECIALNPGPATATTVQIHPPSLQHPRLLSLLPLTPPIQSSHPSCLYWSPCTPVHRGGLEAKTTKNSL